MEAFFTALAARNAALKAQAEALQTSDRKDEANLVKVRANIYEVCGTVCRVHMNRPGGDPDACRAQFEKFQAQWGAAREKAAAHGETDKALIEEIKLEALADIRQKFEEAQS